MDINPPSRFWSAVGRIALLLTVIATGVGLWRNLAPRADRVAATAQPESPAAQLVGTIDYFDFDLPPNIGSQIETLRTLSDRKVASSFISKNGVAENLISRISSSLDRVWNYGDQKNRQYNRLEEALKKDSDRASQLNESLNLSLSAILADYAGSGWMPEYVYRIPEYGSFVIMQIQNAGERQAMGVELQLPYDGIAVVEEPGEKASVRPFDKKIALGTILPKGERKIRMWTESTVTSYSFDLDKWRLAYGDGVGKITWLRKQ